MKTLRMTIEAEDMIVNERWDIIGRSLNLAMEKFGVKLKFRTDLEGKEFVIEIEKDGKR